jgi:Na+/melibiose symporter-like transporter
MGAHPPAAPLARLLSALLPVALAMYANFQGVQQILAPVQVEAIDPPGKIANLAILTMICSITGILGLAGGGAASDATRSRWGRRTPWLVAMAALSAAFSIALGLQRSLVGVAVFYGVLWFTLNFFQAALLAVIPDRIPANRRSLASSIFGFAGPLGTLVGTGVAAFAPDERGNLILALLLAATTAAFIAFAREEPRLAPDVAAEPAAKGRLRLSLSALQSFASRDYALAYIFRILMFVGQFSINNYLLYILQDHIGLERLPGHKAQIAAGALNSLRILTTLSAIVIGLWFAHRT